MEIEDKYKVKHLFLLVGENPLPNYVAAKLLLKNEGERALYLVHTSGTSSSEAAKHLKDILDSELADVDVQQLSIGDNESDAFEIKKAISDTLEHIELEDDDKIGLNYTGGTKAMSVHSYRALFYQEEKDKTQYTKRQNVVFSYLDARRLEMCFDRENGRRDSYKITPEMLKVDLQTIFGLHGWKFDKSKATYEPKLVGAAQALAKLFQEGKDSTEWRKWCDEVFKKDGRFKDEKELKKLDILNVEMLEQSSAIQEVLKLLHREGKQISLKIIKEKGEFQKKKHVWKWLDGEWLEHYVLQQVIDISKELYIHECATSIDFFAKKNQFEFDVAFMRGYQLFAISCTTDDTKSMSKSKLFEAYIRSQQLGGSEARVALVCCANSKNVDELETEITNVFNPDAESSEKDHRLKVFGREDLMNLSAQIKQWIKDVDKEAR